MASARSPHPVSGRGTLPSDNRPRGLLGWWLRLTAPPLASNYMLGRTYAERERLRRAGLTSYIAPFVAVAPFLLSAQAQVDQTTALSIIALLIIVVISLLCNRLGRQTLAALILVAGMELVIEGALLRAGQQGGLGAGWLQTYDLFVIPLITVGILLSRRYLALFAALHIAFILGDFYLLPHAPDLTALVQLWNGDSIAFARPILLQIVGGLLGFVEVRSTDQAIARADRAEDLAELERRELERTHELEEGVRQLLAVHVHLANGDFNVKVPTIRNQLLWQIGSSLNNLVARLGRLAQSDFVVRRTQEEANRLVEALYAVNSGRTPIWPNAAGTPIATLVDTLRNVLSHRGVPGVPGAPGGAGGPQGLHLPPAPGAHMGQGHGPGPNPNFVDPGSRVPTSPNPQAAAYPGYPGNPPAGLPPSGQPATPDWMRALMPDQPPQGGYPLDQQQQAQESPYEPPMGQMAQMGQMPPSRAWAPQAAPDMAGGYGDSPAPERHGETGPANPWSLDPGAPLDDAQLPAWLRDPQND